MRLVRVEQRPFVEFGGGMLLAPHIVVKLARLMDESKSVRDMAHETGLGRSCVSWLRAEMEREGGESDVSEIALIEEAEKAFHQPGFTKWPGQRGPNGQFHHPLPGTVG